MMRSVGQVRVVTGALLSVAALLTGCGGYESNFSCKGYPDTPYCKSVSDAYANRLTPGPVSSDQANGRGDQAAGVVAPSLPTENAMAGKAESMLGKPILKPARSFQAWVAPWKDSKRRLHESSIVYVVVENNEFVYGHMTGKATGTKAGRPRELYPRKGRMVEEAGGRKASSVQSGVGPTLPSKPSGHSNSSYDDSFAGGTAPGPSSVPQGLPVLPPSGASNPYLVDDNALGGPAVP
ncbi:MAG: TraV family lipoprotein [Nitrospira sp.]